MSGTALVQAKYCKLRDSCTYLLTLLLYMKDLTHIYIHTNLYWYVFSVPSRTAITLFTETDLGSEGEPRGKEEYAGIKEQ